MIRALLRIVLFLVVVSAAAYLTRHVWLPWLSSALVHDDGPAKADMAVVLAGDLDGLRVLKAASLVREGYVPKVLVSGPVYYGVHESDLEIQLAVAQGFPAEWFVPLPNTAHSTWEEAAVVLADLRRRNIRSFLLVTSNYHTGRARRAFLKTERAMGGGPQIRAVAAPTRFPLDRWWESREAETMVFLEWCKSVAYALGK